MAIGQYNGWMPNHWPYNMQYQQPNNTIQPIDNIIRVMGPESAKAYILPANSKVILFDADNPIFYLKTTDDSGFATNPRAFKFEEIEMPDIQQLNSNNTSDFITRDDLKNLETDISELKEMLEGLVN